jgi:hypothetical protein
MSPDPSGSYLAPMLDLLSAQQIFAVYGDAKNGFQLVECCDGYFTANLTAEQLRELAAELTAIADGRLSSKCP